MSRADARHAQGPEPGSQAALADSSVAAAKAPQESLRAGELQRPSAGLAAGEQAPSVSTPGAEQNKGEHDLMVATGYTGRPHAFELHHVRRCSKQIIGRPI